MSVVVFGAGAGLVAPERVKLVSTSREFVLTATIDTSSSTVGIADSDLYFMTAEELTTAMETLQGLGVTQIRVFIPWRAIETADGVYDWTQADILLDMAASYDIAVVAAVTSTPTWASDYGGLVANGEPTSGAAYAEFVGALADRYGTIAGDGDAKIAAYEIWNEPNGFTGWYPEPDAEQYTELLKAAYTAIKAIDPEATVIGGVLGAGISIGTLTVDPVTFLAEMYEAGATGYFDALSFHPYNYTSTFSAGTEFINSAIKQLEDLRKLMNVNGDGEKLIWVTEYGQPSTQVSEENQAVYIADFLATWSELAGVGPMFLYSLIDSATGSATAEDNLGLYTDDWTAKAVAEVVKAWIAGHPITPDEGATGPSSSFIDLVATWVKAAQSFVSGISAMIATSFSGIGEFVRGVVTALTGFVASISSSTMSPTAAAESSATLASIALLRGADSAAPVPADESRTDGIEATDSSSDERKVPDVATEPTPILEATSPSTVETESLVTVVSEDGTETTTLAADVTADEFKVVEEPQAGDLDTAVPSPEVGPASKQISDEDDSSGQLLGGEDDYRFSTTKPDVSEIDTATAHPHMKGETPRAKFGPGPINRLPSAQRTPRIADRDTRQEERVDSNPAPGAATDAD